MPECGDSYIHSYPTKPDLKTISKNFGPSPPQALDSLQHLGKKSSFHKFFNFTVHQHLSKQFRKMPRGEFQLHARRWTEACSGRPRARRVPGARDQRPGLSLDHRCQPGQAICGSGQCWCHKQQGAMSFLFIPVLCH